MKGTLIKYKNNIILIESKAQDGVHPEVNYFDDKVGALNIYEATVDDHESGTELLYVKGIPENNRTLHKVIAKGWQIDLIQNMNQDMFDFARFCANDYCLDDSDPKNIRWKSLWGRSGNEEVLTMQQMYAKFRDTPIEFSVTYEYKQGKYKVIIE